MNGRGLLVSCAFVSVLCTKTAASFWAALVAEVGHFTPFRAFKPAPGLVVAAFSSGFRDTTSGAWGQLLTCHETRNFRHKYARVDKFRHMRFLFPGFPFLLQRDKQGISEVIEKFTNVS